VARPESPTTRPAGPTAGLRPDSPSFTRPTIQPPVAKPSLTRPSTIRPSHLELPPPIPTFVPRRSRAASPHCR
jgi:hypothetical protein